MNDPSHIVGICGAAPPQGARLVASEALENPQQSNAFVEAIVEWSNSHEAAQSIMSDADALGGNGCNYSANGLSQQFSSYNPGTPPQGCGGGQTLATYMSINNLTLAGYAVEAQCGTFTILIEYSASYSGSNASLEVTNGYLNSAAGQLMSVIH